MFESVHVCVYVCEKLNKLWSETNCSFGDNPTAICPPPLCGESLELTHCVFLKIVGGEEIETTLNDANVF